MEKAPIKKFAVEARRKLIADVTFQLERYGITEKGIVEPQTSTDKELVFDLGNGNTQTIKGERYVNQYRNLVAHVRGFYADGSPKQQLEQFIEEIAFTWFNRLIAIRFMEVNRYIPVRVLSSEIAGQKLPDLVASPFSGDLDFTDVEKQHIFDLQDANKEDDLFRFLFFKQCNDLSRILPRLFENLEGHGSYSELLVVLSFSDPNGVVYRLVNEVDERWFDIHATDEEGKPMGQVQIIGWMYQYYNTEPKDKVFADLKKNIKISKQNIPAATQLFTPDWIVRYMVENSLGRLWYEGHPGFDKSEWKYYLDEAPQEPQVEQRLQEIRAQYAKMEPEQLKVIDPCMGSGHILCYLFDVLMQIYLDNGYSKREAVRSILENNLFGLDIDKRAAQIAYFSVMMKAREYDSNFFSRSNIPQPRVYDIQESNWLGGAYKHEMGNFLNSQQYRDTLNYLLDAFVDAKEYGSILQIKPLDYEGLKEAWETSASATAHDVNMAMWYDAAKDAVAQLIEQAIMLSQKYDAVVTNPPYMGSSGMGTKLATYIKKNYQESKNDLFSVFIFRFDDILMPNGTAAMIVPQSLMFINGFEPHRKLLIEKNIVTSMAYMGFGAFGADFGTTAFTYQRTKVENYRGSYKKLDSVRDIDSKQTLFLNGTKELYFTKLEDVQVIPGEPLAFWVSNIDVFKNKKLESKLFSGGRIKTHNNEKFVRGWWEVQLNTHWKPYANGGGYRKWYGNYLDVVDWSDTAYNFYECHGGLIKNEYLDKEGITWNDFTSKSPSYRIKTADSLYSSVSPTVFTKKFMCDMRVLGLLNSKVGLWISELTNPTVHTLVGDVLNYPDLTDACDAGVDDKVYENIECAKDDWDAFETSWDFKKHPLV